MADGSDMFDGVCTPEGADGLGRTGGHDAPGTPDAPAPAGANPAQTGRHVAVGKAASKPDANGSAPQAGRHVAGPKPVTDGTGGGHANGNPAANAVAAAAAPTPAAAENPGTPAASDAGVASVNPLRAAARKIPSIGPVRAMRLEADERQRVRLENARRASARAVIDDTSPRGFEALYRSREAEEDESSRNALHWLFVIIVSIVYWPIAIIGVVSPFLQGFNPGGLAMWQVVFSRVWLAFVFLGGYYAVAVNLFRIRDSRLFARKKPLKIIVFAIANFAVTFAVVRLVCMI